MSKTFSRMSVHITRRDFLQATAGVGAVASLGSPFAPAEANATAATAAAQTNAATFPPLAGWFDRPMRWVQLTLVENDPGRFDAQFWLDYFKRLHADAATLSAGGIVAYYPTEVPNVIEKYDGPTFVRRVMTARPLVLYMMPVDQ